MIQIKMFHNEYDVNDWLETNQDKQIIDIKFGYAGTNSWTHEKYMVIYKEVFQEPDVLKMFKDFLSMPTPKEMKGDNE